MLSSWPEEREKDEEFFRRTGYRRFFIVESVDEIAFELKQRLQEYATLDPDTYDFTTMYTEL